MDSRSMEGIDWTMLQVLECRKVNCRKSKSQIITLSHRHSSSRRIAAPPPLLDALYPSLAASTLLKSTPSPAPFVPRRAILLRQHSQTACGLIGFPVPRPISLLYNRHSSSQTTNGQSIASDKIPNPIFTSPHSLTRRKDSNRTLQSAGGRTTQHRQHPRNLASLDQIGMLARGDDSRRPFSDEVD